MVEAMHLYGVPAIEGLSPEEELIVFLKAAAEIEHGLMIQYLYAANGTTDAEMSRLISGIAIEEMGHLLTVQNVLLAMNEKPYLGRYDKSDEDVAPFVFSLEPLTKLVIAKYAACERPDANQIDPEDRDTYNKIVEELTISSIGVIPERVGLLYAKIYWLLRDTDDPLDDPNAEEWAGFPVEEMKKLFPPNTHLSTYPIAEPVLQALRGDWYSGFPSILIFTAETRSGARRAIAGISAQGEGFASEDDGHFDRFISMYRKAQQGTDIAKAVPLNPWYHGVSSTGGDEITAEFAVKLAKLSDYVYELVLNYLALAIHPEQTNMILRSKLASFCVNAMVNCLRTITRRTQNLPINVTTDFPKKFSQCYTLPEGSPEIIAIKKRLEILLQDIGKLCKEFVESDNDDLSLASEEILVSLEQAPRTEYLT